MIAHILVSIFTVFLYPQGQSADKGIKERGVTITLGPGVDNGLRGKESVGPTGNTYNIGDKARMDIYLPDNPNGLMVINCAGGAYLFVCAEYEGRHTAEWLASQGVTVCNLYYRLPNGHKEVPLRDVQNAFRYCRHHAAEWGIRKIGVMGYSAGGHLAASASTLYVDDVTRPDFSILIYPVISMDDSLTHRLSRTNLLGENPSEEDLERYSLQLQVNSNTPETFLALSADDENVPIGNSLEYFQALKRSGVRASLHIYPEGGHGWGFDLLKKYLPTFKADLSGFLQDL